MASQRSLYEILNVAPTAEGVVIEAAYRALMKKYHPDHLAGSASEGSAAEINRAFAILRDPERRSDYDRRQWVRAQDIVLVQSSAPPSPPRRTRAIMFGWSGWIVAVVLGGVIAMMAERATDLARSRAASESESAFAEPDLRSQPALPDEPFVPPIVAAEIRAAALAAKPSAEAMPRSATGAPAPAVRTGQRPRAAATKPHRSAKRQGGSLSTSEREFLEREGYIY
ncbi:J domain-containing protein [Allosphingosinicella deserti]|uniref:J domain-containing protein n=1 Tax=Allosphingosinicella deserti TaxID=2116704 RepID=A0A2P7QGY1_9SPHN|nr:J domain-containing protein [Sphingomonas deserti]PSJ37238.1 hypothetical protein C7I55_22155 [Sphingomonas deserti]